MMGLMSESFYYVCSSENPLAEIFPIITHYNQEYSVRFSFPIYIENSARMLRVIHDLFVSIAIMVILSFTIIIVSYNLVSNYFMRNKRKLFLKSLFGFSFLKRNLLFVIVNLLYVIPILIVLILTSHLILLFIVLIMISLDILFFVIFEKHLMKKTYAQMIKGEG